MLLGSEDMSTLLPASSTAWLWTTVQPSRPTKAVPEAKDRNGGNGAYVRQANSGDCITRGVLACSAWVGDRPATVVVGLSGYSSSRDHHGLSSTAVAPNTLVWWQRRHNLEVVSQ